MKIGKTKSKFIEQKQSLPLRVENLHHPLDENTYYIYCGRGNYDGMFNARLGNPYTVEEYGREKAIYKFIDMVHWNQEYQQRVEALIDHIRPIYGKQPIALACWCKPMHCHCEYIKHLIEENI